MIRNTFSDPEASPSKGGYQQNQYNNPYRGGGPPSPAGSESATEDEWFTSSGPDYAANQFAPGLNYRGGNGGNGGNGNGNGNIGGGQYNTYGGMGGMQGGYHHGGGGLGATVGGSVGGYDDDDDSDDVPLLEELGIRFDHILSKTLAVMYPMRRLSEEVIDDADLAGPLVFALLLGSCLLLAGKVHFGYIYGFSVFGSLGFNSVLSLLHHQPISYWLTCSVLGYCLLPVIALAVVSIVLSLKGFVGLLLSAGAICWSSFSAVRMFDAKLRLAAHDQFYLVAYPLVLLYSCFTLITIF